MNMRTVMDPAGSNTGLVDKRIGNAYPAVEAVYQKLAEIIYLAHNFDQLRPREVEFRDNNTDRQLEWRYLDDPEWFVLVTYADLLGADIPEVMAYLENTRQEVAANAQQVAADTAIVVDKTPLAIEAAASALESKNASAISEQNAANSEEVAAESIVQSVAALTAAQQLAPMYANAILGFAELADAETAAGNLPNDQLVDVLDVQNRYRVLAGALLFEKNLDQLRIDLAEPGGSSKVGFQQSWEDAAPRDVAEKLREFVSVTDSMNIFEIADSLSANPSLDHTAAFQKALNNNNFIDVLDGRNYRIDGNLTKILGAGEMFVIRGKSTVKRYNIVGATLRITGAGDDKSRAHVHVRFDGNESGVIRYSSGNPVTELSIAGVGTVVVKSRFTNTSYASFIATGCGDVYVSDGEFSEGVPYYGSASATTTFYIQVSRCRSLGVKRTKFFSNITYGPGNYNSANPQLAVTASAPIAVYADYTDSVNIRYNECDNVGHFDVYEKVKHVRINRNDIKRSHGPLKVQNFLSAEVVENTIIDPLHYWGGAIALSPYSRVDTYGWLGAGQGDITVRGNRVYNSRSREGVITALGALYSEAILDQRIAQQGLATTNIVYKVGAEYFYKDFDGTVTGPINQEYLCASSITIDDNRSWRFATTGILAARSASSISIKRNKLFNAASIDTVYATTKVVITASDSPVIDVGENFLHMGLGDVPRVNGVETFVIGVSINGENYMKNRVVASLRGNAFALGYVQQGALIGDTSLFSAEDNVFALLSFKPSGQFIRALRRNNIGRFLGNAYKVDDAANAPSASAEYVNKVANFNSVVDEDIGYSAATRNVRNIMSSLDFSTPNQVAAGVYGVGSVIRLDANINKKFWRCEQAGGLAPAYSAVATYSAGNKVKSVEGNYFVANKTNLAILPPVTATSSTDWEYLTSTSATFVEYAVSPVA